MKYLKSIILILLTAVLLFTTIQCNNDGNDNNENKLEDGSTFYGGLLKETMLALAKGAVGKIGGGAMGNMLDLLGWGDSDNDIEKDALKKMDGKLDTIIDMLTDLGGFLQSLLAQLLITEEEILANANDPTAFLNEIDTYHSDLGRMVGDTTKPGEGDQQDILDFADYIEDGLRIQNDVNGIFHAIYPQTSAKTPVLNNYTDLLLNRISTGNGTFTDAYLSLELYTSQLVINQLKGVNLVVEAYNLDDNDTSAKTYFDSYNESILTEEIDNPGNELSFMYNVYRMALSTVNPQSTSGQDAFPGDTKDFLKRALFYRHTALHGDQNEGLHVLIIETQESDDFQDTLTAVNQETGETYTLNQVSATRNVPGNIYDQWNDDAHLSPGMHYNVYHFSGAGADMDIGTYKIGLSPSVLFGRPVSVDSYNSDYSVVSEGGVLDRANNHGVVTFLFRSPKNHAKIQTHWTARHHNTQGTSITDGWTDDGVYYLPYELHGYKSDLDSYDGWAQLRHYFDYAGADNKTVYVDFSANVSGYLYTQDYGIAQMDIHFGVWDVTADKRVSDTEGNLSFKAPALNDGVNKKFSDVSHGTATFTAKPDHHYRTYYYLRASGSGNDFAGSQGAIRIDSLNHEYFRFE
jgi:hypothetical protein